VCEEIQSVSAINFIDRGAKLFVGTVFNQGLNISSCVNCGQCIMVCPTGSLTEKSSVEEVLVALSDPTKRVVVQHAPAVSVTIAEEFGIQSGEDYDGKMVAALRRMGFDWVFDTSFTADLTIMEEASELVHRIKNGGVLPMMTSCSPGWIKFVEQFYPEFIPNLSSCKSPQQMMGTLIKSYFAEKNGMSPESIVSVSIMPCTAKKFEASRPEMGRNHISDIDYVLTTRELGRIMKLMGINLDAIEPESPDSPFGERSSAGKIFGATGGVMEAAIRTAYYMLTGNDLETIDVKEVRGLMGRKTATVVIGGLTMGAAVVSSLGQARQLLDEIKAGRNDIHFIEVMTCPGGCLNGGGQPHNADSNDIKARLNALYGVDTKETLRLSHRNQWVQRLYKEFLGQPLSEKSHHYLHTHYHKRDVLL
jgi:NADH-quinone oxidoreductase subunit G/NADP-reducing hydrogenase subunit HndD